MSVSSQARSKLDLQIMEVKNEIIQGNYGRASSLVDLDAEQKQLELRKFNEIHAFVQEENDTNQEQMSQERGLRWIQKGEALFSHSAKKVLKRERLRFGVRTPKRGT